ALPAVPRSDNCPGHRKMRHRFDPDELRLLPRLRVGQPPHLGDVDGIAGRGGPVAFHKKPPVGGYAEGDEREEDVASPSEPFHAALRWICQLRMSNKPLGAFLVTTRLKPRLGNP